MSAENSNANIVEEASPPAPVLGTFGTEVDVPSTWPVGDIDEPPPELLPPELPLPELLPPPPPPELPPEEGATTVPESEPPEDVATVPESELPEIR